MGQDGSFEVQRNLFCGGTDIWGVHGTWFLGLNEFLSGLDIDMSRLRTKHFSAAEVVDVFSGVRGSCADVFYAR